MEKRFYVCICEAGHKWESGRGPATGDIVTLVDTDFDEWGLWYKFKEWPAVAPLLGFYNPDFFRPIDYSVGERVCESIERQPVKQLA